MDVLGSVFPTGVGMDRLHRPLPVTANVFPTGVGMDRAEVLVIQQCFVCSPQAWGWARHKLMPSSVGISFSGCPMSLRA